VQHPPSGPRPLHYRGFIITFRHIPVGVTPLDEWSVRRRDLYLTTHTKLTTDRHPSSRRDSNPQSQQASGLRSTPLTVGTDISSSNSTKILLFDILKISNTIVHYSVYFAFKKETSVATIEKVLIVIYFHKMKPEMETFISPSIISPRIKIQTPTLNVFIWVCTGGADNSLARPGSKKATVTEDFDFHISCL